MNMEPVGLQTRGDADIGSHPLLSPVLRPALFATILLLLAALIVLPEVIGRRVDALRDRISYVVVPARDAVQESQAALTEAVAAVRGFQLSGDPLFIDRARDALSRERIASGELAELAGGLGPEAVSAVREYGESSEAWMARARALIEGRITREDLIGSTAEGQQLVEHALAAAGRAQSALSRHEAELDESIRSGVATARVLIFALALCALAIALIFGWLMSRLQHLTLQLQTRAELLRGSEERFRSIAENLREAIWISDPGYTVQYYLSPAWATIWGRSLDQARDDPRSFLAWVHPDDRTRVESALESYEMGRYAAEYRIIRPDGSIRWVHARAYPVCGEDGTVVRVVGIAEDITTQKEIQQEREELLERERTARSEVEAALQVRDRVLRTVSHDLKNPLHTIGMAAELMEMPLPDEQRERQVAIIRRTVNRANRLVTDLLDVARIESGQAVTIRPQTLNVGALIGEAVDSFRMQAEKKEILLEHDVDEHTPDVHADPDRLLQALSNLVGNAVKFTPRGGTVRVLARSAPGGAVCFTVADTGPGIPEDLLPHLFQPFAQARDTASLGSGLGLSIAHAIVEAHDGTISVESEAGRGSTFTLTLPAATGPDDAARDGVGGPVRAFHPTDSAIEAREHDAP